MVRIGGGWDTLDNYLNRHDPCRYHMLGKCFSNNTGIQCAIIIFIVIGEEQGVVESYCLPASRAYRLVAVSCRFDLTWIY